MSNERTVAREVRDEYVETMSKIYYSYFKSYTSRLMKLQVSQPLVTLFSFRRTLQSEFVISFKLSEILGGFLLLQFEEVADKDDLMGVEDTAKRDILSRSEPFV